MSRRVVVYRSVGDPDMGAAAIEGMIVVTQPAPLDPDQMAVVKAELEATKEKLRDTEAKLGVKKPRENREFRAKIRKTNRAVKPVREHKILDKLFGIYALMWLLIYEFYERQLKIWKGED